MALHDDGLEASLGLGKERVCFFFFLFFSVIVKLRLDPSVWLRIIRSFPCLNPAWLEVFQVILRAANNVAHVPEIHISPNLIKWECLG